MKVLPLKNVTSFRPDPIIAMFHESFYHKFAHLLNSTKILPPGNYPLYGINGCCMCKIVIYRLRNLSQWYWQLPYGA